MGRASAVATFAGSVREVEARWYDLDGWPAWVDGLARVIRIEGDWPHVGATVTWESTPAGRGSVREVVTSHEPRAGQTLAVQDDSIRGYQSVAFHELEGGVQVQLALDYELTARSIVTPLVDVLFIRRAITNSLAATLARFGAELVLVATRARAPRGLGVAELPGDPPQSRSMPSGGSG